MQLAQWIKDFHFYSIYFSLHSSFYVKNISALNKIFDDFYVFFGFALYFAESYHVLLWKKEARMYLWMYFYKQKMVNAFRESMQTILWLKLFFVHMHGPLFANRHFYT